MTQWDLIPQLPDWSTNIKVRCAKLITNFASSSVHSTIILYFAPDAWWEKSKNLGFQILYYLEHCNWKSRMLIICTWHPSGFDVGHLSMHLIFEGCCECVIGIGPCQFEFWGPKLRQTCLDCLQQSFFNYLYTTCSTAINKPFQLNRFKRMCGSHLKTQGAAVRTRMMKVITCSSITFKDEIICSFTTSFLDYLTWNLNVEDGVRHGQHGLH